MPEDYKAKWETGVLAIEMKMIMNAPTLSENYKVKWETGVSAPEAENDNECANIICICFVIFGVHLQLIRIVQRKMNKWWGIKVHPRLVTRK